jgi:hypothetical protein
LNGTLPLTEFKVDSKDCYTRSRKGHMKLTDKLPTPVTWIVRVVCWSASLMIIWGLFSFYASLKTVNHVEACFETIHHRATGKETFTSLDAAQELVACLDKRAGFPEKFMYASTKKTIQSLPSTPPRYVGVWTASRINSVYRVTLRDDSQYSAVPLRDNTPGAQALSGSWGVNDGRMIWLPDTGRFWPPDINPITDINDITFTLREADGSTTRYELVERVPSSQAP